MTAGPVMRGKRGRDRRLAASSTGSSGSGSGAGRRQPDLSALPPLLAATGTFADLRRRLALLERSVPGGSSAATSGTVAGTVAGPAAGPTRHPGRHVGLSSIPHGAKSFLAATLAGVVAGERLAWIARDAEIGDRVAEELSAWLGDPALVVVLEPRTALAYERSELVADETAARVAALSAWRSGDARILVASVQALLQHTIAPDDLPAEPRRLAIGGRLRPEALLRELLALGYSPAAEVAGRGEFARRGGIVDVFPPSAALPVRIEFFGDEIDSLRAFDPADQRTVGPLAETILLPASEFLAPHEGAAALRERLGKAAAKLPERLAADLARFEGDGAESSTDANAPAPARLGSGTAEELGAATRALHVGDAAEVWAAQLAPSTGFDHVLAATLLVLDEPGEIAEAATFLWGQADERRAELIESGELTKDWPSTYLGPRDWKTRLVASRTLELTWESEMPEAVALASRGLSS
ncbi:MAG: hypothetical protein ABIZ72_07650, partial [Candidatus Limnocylindrales bacterium]